MAALAADLGVIPTSAGPATLGSRLLGSTSPPQRQRQACTRRVTTLLTGAKATPYSSCGRGSICCGRDHGYAPRKPCLCNLGPRWYPRRDDRRRWRVRDYRGCSAAVPSACRKRPVQGGSLPHQELFGHDLLLSSTVPWRQAICRRAGWPLVDRATAQAYEEGCGITTRCS